MRYARIDKDRTEILEWRFLTSPKLLRMPDQSQKLNPTHDDFIAAGWLSEHYPETLTDFRDLNNPIMFTTEIIYLTSYKTTEECKDILKQKVKNIANDLITHAHDVVFENICEGEKVLYSRFIERALINDTTYFEEMGGSKVDGATFIVNEMLPALALEYWVKRVIGIRSNYIEVIDKLDSATSCENFDYQSNWDEAGDFGELDPVLLADEKASSIWTSIKDNIINIFDDPALK